MRKFRLSIIILSIFILFSILSGFFVKKLYDPFNVVALETKENDGNLCMICAVDDYIRNEDYYSNIVDESIVLQVKLNKKENQAGTIISSVEVQKIYSDNSGVKIGDNIMIIENYEVLTNSKGNFIEFSDGLNLPLYIGNEYIVLLKVSELSPKYYEFKMLNFSCYDLNENYYIYTTKVDLDITAEDKQVALYFEIDDLSDNSNLKWLSGIDDLSEYNKSYNDLYINVLKRLAAITGIEHFDNIIFDLEN